MAGAKLTTRDLLGAFGVTPMTITNWRAGSATRGALPAEKVGRHVVYSPAEVRKWARKFSVPIADEQKLLGGAGRLRPGPRPKSPEKTLGGP